MCCYWDNQSTDITQTLCKRDIPSRSHHITSHATPLKYSTCYRKQTHKHIRACFKMRREIRSDTRVGFFITHWKRLLRTKIEPIPVMLSYRKKILDWTKQRNIFQGRNVIRYLMLISLSDASCSRGLLVWKIKCPFLNTTSNIPMVRLWKKIALSLQGIKRLIGFSHFFKIWICSGIPCSYFKDVHYKYPKNSTSKTANFETLTVQFLFKSQTNDNCDYLMF